MPAKKASCREAYCFFCAVIDRVIRVSSKKEVNFLMKYVFVYERANLVKMFRHHMFVSYKI